MGLLTSYIHVEAAKFIGALKTGHSALEKPHVARKKVFYLPLCYTFFIFFILFTFVGCCSYRSDVRNYSTKQFSTIKPKEKQKLALHRFEQAACHPVYSIVAKDKEMLNKYAFGSYFLWALFGNDDDGVFGEGVNACYNLHESPSFIKACKWWLRNPLHNFCFYVIGSANRVNSEIELLKITSKTISTGKYTPIAKTNFASQGSCFYLCLHGGKPFISLRIRYNKHKSFDFYIGWRERGNFGIKLCPFATTPTNKEKQQEA